MSECIPASDCFEGGCCCGMGLEAPDLKHGKEQREPGLQM